MLFWRVFLTVAGMVCGAIIGLCIVAATQWLDGFFILLLGGALLGAACGLAISSTIPRTVQRLRERFPPDDPPLPPPRNVVRFGAVLGVTEGVVVGAVYSGSLAAVLGGFIGMFVGLFTAALSWQVRRHIPLVMLALVLGFLIEVVGCFIIVFLVSIINMMANDPVVMYIFMMYIFGVTMVVGIRAWRLARLRRFRPTRQEEDPGLHET